jgi:subtilisin family serine protease/chitodextrinase
MKKRIGDWSRSLKQSRFNRKELIAFALIFASIGGFIIFYSHAAPNPGDTLNNKNNDTLFASNEILIKVKSSQKGNIKSHPTPADTGIVSLNAVNQRLKAKNIESVAKASPKAASDQPLFRWYKVTLNEPRQTINKKDVAASNQLYVDIGQYKHDPAVEDAQPNFIYQVDNVPNDPFYSSVGAWGQAYDDMYGMKKINAPAAWDQTTGSKNIVVASIDTGVDRNHEDLKDNMWVNDKEIPGNGIDDDKNGFVDDYYGWDFANNDNDPIDDHGHGSHTVGTIAGSGNNGLGVVGVNWTSRVMALKALDSNGAGYSDRLGAALQYAADMGARVSSNSWGGNGFDGLVNDSVNYEHAKGMVTVVAAGNSNTDALDFTPASDDAAITVAASDWNDAKASFSNYGSKIDVAAPGVNILSVRAAVNNMCTGTRVVATNYCVVSGTSMATPHVAGLAALLLAKNPNLTNEEIRQILRTSATDLAPAGKDSSFGFGRIDAGGSMNLVATHPLTPYITSPASRATLTGLSTVISGSVGGTNFASYKLEYGVGRAPSAWTTINTSATQPATTTVLGTFNTSSLVDGTYTVRLTAADAQGKTYEFEIYDLVSDHFDTVISSPAGRTPLNSVGIYGTVLAKNGLSMANYKVEWASDLAPNTWSTSGITLANGGTLAVANAKLADWDTSQLVDGQTYSIRVTQTSTVGLSDQVSSYVVGDKDIIKGWPKVYSYDTNTTYCVCQTTETFGDLYGDGNKEIVVAAPDGTLYAYKKDGSALTGFPAPAHSANDIYTNGSVDIADLDGDGKAEIVSVVQVSGQSPAYTIYITRSDGTDYTGWPKPKIDIGAHTPSVADLNGDGKKEIAFVSTGSDSSNSNTIATVHAFELNGTELNGFPKSTTMPPIGFDASTMFPSESSGTSITDLDGDGKPEIAWSYSNRIYLFDNNGNVLPGWPFIVPNFNNNVMVFESPPASGNTLGNGKKQLYSLSTASCQITSGGTYAGVCYLGNGGYTELFGFNKDGSVIPGFPKTNTTDGIVNTNNNGAGTVALADIDNDGKDEVIVGAANITIFDADTGKKNLLNSPAAGFQPSVADADGDGMLDFVTAYYDTVTISKQSSSQFTQIWSRNLHIGSSNNKFYYPPVISDIDKNGKMELGGVAGPSGLISTSLSSNAYLWEIPATAGKYDWTMLYHDPSHTSQLVTTPSTSDSTLPTVSISAPASGASVSGIVTVVASASDNVAVASVDFLVDGTLATTVTASPYTFAWDCTKATNGTHTIMAQARDASGNSSSSIVTLNVSNGDTTAPSAPTGLVATAAASNNVNLTWTASTDNVGVAGYYIVRNGVTIAQTTGSATSYSDSTVAASSTYSYQVMAYDAKANVSSLSNTSSVTTPATADTTPPTAPSNVLASAVSASQINLSWSPSSDNVGVNSYDVYRNGSRIVSINSSSACTSTICSYGNSGLSASTVYSYYVIARDAAANSSPASNTSSATTLAPPPITNGTLAGSISSSKGGVLSGTTIALKFSGANHSYISDSSGSYVVANIPAGSYTVKYSKPGFVTKSLTVTITTGNTTAGNVTLVSRK